MPAEQQSYDSVSADYFAKRGLRRYAGVVDWALLYPPHFGVDQERLDAHDLSLIEVASGWTS